MVSEENMERENALNVLHSLFAGLLLRPEVFELRPLLDAQLQRLRRDLDYKAPEMMLYVKLCILDVLNRYAQGPDVPPSFREAAQSLLVASRLS